MPTSGDETSETASTTHSPKQGNAGLVNAATAESSPQEVLSQPFIALKWANDDKDDTKNQQMKLKI